MEKVIARGAEAVIIKTVDSITKKRISKGYRIEQLDTKLRKRRTKAETKILEKASKLIPVPEVIDKDTYEIQMSFIQGKKLSDHLDSIKNPTTICKQIGKSLAILHNNGLIHGDLTTSNLILKQEKVYFIDFGLGFHSDKLEDKAVDLHLIKQALEARHSSKFKTYFQAILTGYKESKDYKRTIDRLKKVEARGRYKKQ